MKVDTIKWNLKKKRGKSEFCTLLFLLEPFRTECLMSLFNKNAGIFMTKTYSDDNKIVKKKCIFITFLLNIFLESFSSRKSKALLTFCII